MESTQLPIYSVIFHCLEKDKHYDESFTAGTGPSSLTDDFVFPDKVDLNLDLLGQL